MKFSDMKISSSTLDALTGMNYNEPTEVQEKAIPVILQGKEVIVRSQTGTGKTAAFGIGLIEQIMHDKSKKALVLAPTRELALQITKEIRSLASNHRMRVFVVYGGEDIGRQLQLISKGYEIIVATPGRLLDHFRRKTIDLSVFNLIVLDEADRMLDMGFKEDIDIILDNISLQRQIMLFSATINQDIKNITNNFMRDPVTLEIGPEEKAPTIDEEFIKLERAAKFAKLKEILHQEAVSRVIVFVATKRAAEYVGKKLYEYRMSASYLHGDMRQAKREKIMRDFREGRFRVLVATDVAARGLHIEEVSHIINYDQANDQTTHTHRIGRTGRMGKKGKAITFIETDADPRRMMRRSSPGQGYNRGYSRGPGRGYGRGHGQDKPEGQGGDYGRTFKSSKYAPRSREGYGHRRHSSSR